MSRRVMTVLGPIAADELGIALTHEHIMVHNLSKWQPPKQPSKHALAFAKVTPEILCEIKRNIMLVRDNLILDDEAAAIDELMAFRLEGGTSVVDVTSVGLGRDPEVLARVSRATGLSIVMGCGYYQQPSHPAYVAGMVVDEIADEMIRDLTDGVGDTGVRAGIIGEIGTSVDGVHPDEERVLRAAAKAHRHTGAAISVHPAPWGNNGLEILDLLEAEGANPNKVIICHLDHNYPLRDQLDYHKAIATRGAYCEYDLWGAEWDAEELDLGVPCDNERAESVREMMDAGFLSRILLSHDVAAKMNYKRYGGNGYDHLLRHGVRLLRRNGLSTDDIRTIMEKNPREVLSVGSRQPAESGKGG